MIKIKRISETPSDSDGVRVFVDRVWPRTVRKEEARVDAWMKDLAPSADLRKWFNGDPERWDEFRRRYRDEIRDRNEDIHALIQSSREGTITLLYSTRDDRFNEASALQECLNDHCCNSCDNRRREERELATVL